MLNYGGKVQASPMGPPDRHIKWVWLGECHLGVCLPVSPEEVLSLCILRGNTSSAINVGIREGGRVLYYSWRKPFLQL